VTYQQYMNFLENDMGEESQESLIRQEELKDRKNKIIQLLNGEISEDEHNAGDLIDQSSGQEDEEFESEIDMSDQFHLGQQKKSTEQDEIVSAKDSEGKQQRPRDRDLPARS
jgi:hypothetical protein